MIVCRPTLALSWPHSRPPGKFTLLATASVCKRPQTAAAPAQSSPCSGHKSCTEKEKQRKYDESVDTKEKLNTNVLQEMITLTQLETNG